MSDSATAARARRARRQDRAARFVITGTGVGTILVVITILLVILFETLPLFRTPTVTLLAEIPLSAPFAAGEMLAGGMDESGRIFWVLNRAGEIISIDPAAPGVKIVSTALAASGRVLEARSDPGNFLTVLRAGGRVELHALKLEGQRNWRVERLAAMDLPGKDWHLALGTEIEGGGSLLAAVQKNSGRIILERRTRSENLLGEASEETARAELAVAGEEITTLEADRQAQFLYAGTRSGRVLRWNLTSAAQPELINNLAPAANAGAVMALAIMLGDTALAVGFADGTVLALLPVVDDDGARVLKTARVLPRFVEAPVFMCASPRDRTLLVAGSTGNARLYYTTDESELARFSFATGGPASFAMRGRRILQISPQFVRTYELHADHPEASLKALWGRIWYEGYPRPDFTWQSSSGHDEFEPKLSLVPLMVGSFKGAFYALLFSMPLSLLAALYTSLFAPRRVKAAVKPLVEIMAAVPSVVVGFLAALWFAPLMDRHLLYVPAAALLAVAAVLLLFFHQGRARSLATPGLGMAFVILVSVLLLAVPLALVLESAFFAGDFRLWIARHVPGYEQRNSIVIAFALGFAVMPILYSMAEDALSNVPRSLVTGSLALGATPWQTAVRVVLPAAGPGILAGLMLGFGRAVGETMIVLMATGNTPILDLSPWNGMRTLAANIAVEIPEAPLGGTLYRVLFLSAAVLFLLTSVLNTAAELVRQRLRRVYAKF